MLTCILSSHFLTTVSFTVSVVALQRKPVIVAAIKLVHSYVHGVMMVTAISLSCASYML